jgi:uncharacterized membrane protein YgcG
VRRLTVVLGLLAVLLGVAAAPALAEPPQTLSDQVTDSAGVLSGSDEQQLRETLTNLERDHGIRLYATFVNSFDGMSGKAWTTQAGQQSGLGGHDALLAVAVQDRKFDIHTGTSIPDSRVQGVEAQVQDQLASKDWAGAVTTLADGLAGGSGSSTSSGSGLSSGAVTGIVLVVLLALGAGSYLFFRSRRRRRELEAEQRQAVPQGPPDPYAGVPTDELNARASSALLDVDEKVRTAQVNLDYARSYYGEEAVPGYAQAFAQAADELGKAFHIRQLLDDDIPEDEPTTRRMLADLLKLTGDADQRLQAQAQAVDALRERERTAPQAMDDLLRRIGELQQRLPQEQQRLADLGTRYAPSAFSAVADNVDQAGVRLAAAEQALGEARQAQQEGHAGRTVGRLLPAEQAVGQSVTLLDAIERQARDLATAEQRIAAARADTEADLAEARSMLRSGDQGGLQAQVARAEAALAAADTALRPSDGGRPDPLAALRRIEEADGELRQGLQSARDAQTQARKAAEALDQALLTARSAVSAAGDFISTRRGAVGPEARTRLAEAQRHLDAAQAQASADPQAALREAQRADQLAQYALQVAQSDVEQWSQQTGYGWGGGYGGPGWGGGYGGGWGGYGGWGRRGGGGSGLGWGLGGLLLGGLLFGDHDNDHGGGWGGDGGAGWGGGGDFGGGWGGGGDFGGDFGGGGDSGGSF